MKLKERAEHFTEMFVKMRKRLPNLQSYVMTEADLMRVLNQCGLVKKINKPDRKNNPRNKAIYNLELSDLLCTILF